MKKSIILFLLLTTSVALFAQFEICNSNTSKSLNDVYFFDENTGVAVGDSVIIRSVDGGMNWEIIIDDGTINFSKVKFWDDNHGLAIGNKCYSTNDGGLNWKNQDAFTDIYFSDVELFDNYEFVVSGSQNDQNKIFKGQLIDDEVNVLFESLVDFGIHHLSFINESDGFAHHFNGSGVNSILKTNDGGINWELQTFQTEETFTLIEDIVFINDQIGFLGGWYNAALMKTIDGGVNWQTVNIENTDNTDNTIFDIPQVLDFHINAQSTTFYSCGWHGELFKTTDSGSNWTKLDSPIGSGTSLTGIYFIDEHTGWAVGHYGTIIKTTNGGTITKNNNIFTEKINCYPNPFSSAIQVNLPIGDFEQIKLYNLAGQLLKVTRHNIIADLDDLPSGIYLLSIENEQSIQNFKVVKSD